MKELTTTYYIILIILTMLCMFDLVEANKISRRVRECPSSESCVD